MRVLMKLRKKYFAVISDVFAFFEPYHKLDAHKYFSHSPACFNTAGRPTDIVGNAVYFPTLHVKSAAPAAVKS